MNQVFVPAFEIENFVNVDHNKNIRFGCCQEIFWF